MKRLIMVSGMVSGDSHAVPSPTVAGMSGPRPGGYLEPSEAHDPTATDALPNPDLTAVADLVKGM